MIRAQFRFSTEILRRLGEELNPSLDQGMIELVKNAYDADARSCTIELIDTERAGGSVRVVDDGEGMDDEAIKSGWLVLGRSSKAPRRKTRIGRTPSGSKGLGRLAALRMGDLVILTSRPRTAPRFQYRLRIDWSAYEKTDLVDEVILEIKRVARERGTHNGSRILIKDLKAPVSRMDVKRLARSLLLLADPFGDDPKGFQPTLTAPEFADLEALVKHRYFKDADYHLVARIDSSGLGRAAVVDWRGLKLFSADHKGLTSQRNGRPYLCPRAYFDLWSFILSSTTFSTRHTTTLQEVRAWLETFGGVHVYHNGLRVNPYGNPGNDWLEMNLARARSPEERPSTNTSIGRVRILDPDSMLVQKTDRSGFIESPEYSEIRRFAKDALDWMAKRRLEIAEKRRIRERVQASSESRQERKSLARVIKKVPTKTRVIIKDALAQYERVRDKEVAALRNEVQLYRTLSTAGITAATFAHESGGNPLKIITAAAKTIERRGRQVCGKQYEPVLEEPVSLIKKSVDSLKVLSTVTLSLLDHDKRRAARVNVHETITRVLRMFKPFLDERSIEVLPELDDGAPYLQGSEAAIEAIITNLLDNSVVWLEKSQGEGRKIVIRTHLRNGNMVIRVFDNGPGLVDISKEDIWLPGQSTRPNGTGLGLTIVRDTVKDLGGSVTAVEHSELGGAEIAIEVPILGVDG